MKKAISILLIWILSVFFAEFYSWASANWIYSPVAYFIVIPLYLSHLIFLLWIAYKYKKISISQLYFLWAIFWLYEAWVTKVLWSWYMHESWPGMWTFLWLSIPEFPVLVFFYHPIMSFILPILIYQIFTWKAFIEHSKILEKSKKKNYIIYTFIIIIASFIANWNWFEILKSNINYLWWLFAVILLYKLNKKKDILNIILSKKWLWINIIYLFILYIFTFIVFLPERIPTTIIPYISIILSYIFFVYIFKKTNESSIDVCDLDKKHYSFKDFIYFSIFLLVMVNIYSIIDNLWFVLMVIWYFSMIILWLLILYFSLKKLKIKKAE